MALKSFFCFFSPEGNTHHLNILVSPTISQDDVIRKVESEVIENEKCLGILVRIRENDFCLSCLLMYIK